MNVARAARLRELLLDPAQAQRILMRQGTPAAVLAPLFSLDGELHVLFTRRHDDLRHHAGQISFPGGRREPVDDDLLATALREANEEIGLDPAAVTVVGALRPIHTVVTAFAVYPFVGLIERPSTWAAAPEEVDSIIELPLRELAAVHEVTSRRRDGRSFKMDTFTVREHTIWGATGRILADLLHRLAPLDADV